MSATRIILLLFVSGLAPLAQAAGDPVEEVVVVAHPLSGEGLAQAVEVVEGDELAQAMQSSLGETLAGQPGIHSSSFGQASSRPVIHGLAGARVRVMEDRIDSLDASVTSADHAVSVEAFMADRIEVLKGPSTLLYGSGAIGGVVDVHTGRIPHRPAAAPLSGRAELRIADNAARSVAAARIDGGVNNLAWHVDGFHRDADAYDIPVPAESARLRQLEGDDDAAGDGTVAGSQLRASGGALGAAYVSDGMFAGAALSTIDSRYGLPGGHAHEEEAGGEPEGTPQLVLQQTRLDLEGGWSEPLPWLSSLNLRAAFNDYEHQEIEPDGESGTLFTNKAYDARVEFNYAGNGTWNGAVGLQLGGREFAAIGEEAFVPPVDTYSAGLFWVGERFLGQTQLELGFRVDTVRHEPRGANDDRYTASAVSVGLIRPFDNGWQLSMHGDLSSRAPVAEELYSDGPHLATRSFEIGDPGLDEEQVASFAMTLAYNDETFSWVSTAYLMKFSDFIYQQQTDAIEDGLPVQQYSQADATFYGVDADISAQVARWDSGTSQLRFSFDTVTAQLDAGSRNLPRIPPARLRLALDTSWSGYQAVFHYSYARAVRPGEVASGELPTDSYTDLGMYISRTVPVRAGQLELFLLGRNLTDQEQRNHASFIKDFVPQPGRTLELGARLKF